MTPCFWIPIAAAALILLYEILRATSRPLPSRDDDAVDYIEEDNTLG